MTYHVSNKDKAIAVSNSWANSISHRDKCGVSITKAIVHCEESSLTLIFYWQSVEDIERYLKLKP